MSSKKKFLINLGLLVIMWVVLFVSFTLLKGKPMWVYMIVAGVFAGIYGVVQRIIRDKYK